MDVIIPFVFGALIGVVAGCIVTCILIIAHDGDDIL